MAQAPNTVAINDGSATPVAVTFTCVKASPVLSVFKDKRLTRINQWPEITISSDLPSSKAKTRTAELRIAVPVVDAISNEVTDTVRFRGSFDLPLNATAADVKNAFAYAQNALSNAIFKAAIVDPDPLIG